AESARSTSSWSSPAAAWRSSTTTCRPRLASAAATAAPSPEAPPVTIATLRSALMRYPRPLDQPRGGAPRDGGQEHDLPAEGAHHRLLQDRATAVVTAL